VSHLYLFDGLCDSIGSEMVFRLVKLSDNTISNELFFPSHLGILSYVLRGWCTLPTDICSPSSEWIWQHCKSLLQI